MEQSLTSERGLPGRSWFRHLIYAPGLLTGYGVKTLPGVREAIEQQPLGGGRRLRTTHRCRARRVLRSTRSGDGAAAGSSAAALIAVSRYFAVIALRYR